MASMDNANSILWQPFSVWWVTRGQSRPKPTRPSVGLKESNTPWTSLLRICHVEEEESK
jgi:hypothetical protein